VRADGRELGDDGLDVAVERPHVERLIDVRPGRLAVRHHEPDGTTVMRASTIP